MTNLKKTNLSLLVATTLSFSGCGSSSSNDTTVDTTKPAFISAITATVTENQTTAITVKATDTNTITYTLSGGDDKSIFDIDSSRGVVTFKTAPDFESPKDSNRDNNYSITVSATDVAKNTSNQNIVISVSNDTSDDISKSTVSGKVADGYLDKAKVCLDKNENAKCDTDEPNTLSVNGQYDLNVTTTDVGKYPIVVEVVAGQTIDADNASGDTVSKAYTLTAPKDSTGFISPITTLINEQILQNPALTTNEASYIIGKDLNLTTNDSQLLTDYVVNENTNDTDKKLHEVGKVTASLLAQSYEKVENDLNTDLTDEQKEATKSLITKNIKSNILTLALSIKNGKKISELTSDITTLVNDTNITSDKIKTESQKINLKKNAEIKTFANMIGIQFYHFFRDGASLKVETWTLHEGKVYEGSKNLQTAINNGITNYGYNDMKVSANYIVQEDNTVVFNKLNSNDEDDDSYTTTQAKVAIMDLSKKTYTINDILYLAVEQDINDDSLRPQDVDHSKLHSTIPFETGDNLIIGTMYDRNTGKYYGKSINFNKSAMGRILSTLRD
jgi:hypothetical protein